jgi:hypothetical protein
VCFQPSLRDSVNREDIPALKRRAIFKCPAGTIHAEYGTARRVHVPNEIRPDGMTEIRAGFIVMPAALKKM